MLQYNVTCFSTKSNFFTALDLNYFPLWKSLTCKTIRNYFSKWSLCSIAWLSARSGTFSTSKDTEYLCENHHAPIPTYLLTYLLTPWCRVLLEKLTGLQLVKKLSAFHGIRRFITALTSVRHPSLSWASPIQSIYPHLLEIHPNIIHPSTPRSPQWSPSLRFPHQDPIHPPLLTHIRHMPSQSHSSPFYHPHNIGRGVQII